MHPEGEFSLSDCLIYGHEELGTDGQRHMYTGCMGCQPLLFDERRHQIALNITELYPHQVGVEEKPSKIPAMPRDSTEKNPILIIPLDFIHNSPTITLSSCLRSTVYLRSLAGSS